MYRILADGQLFCSSKIEELAVINPVIDMEVNKAGTFKFIVPPTHPYYDVIERKKTLIDVYRDNETEPLFEGICASVEVDFFKQKSITCEGELTFLNDSTLRPSHKVGLTSRQLLEAYINEHNSLVEAQKRFTVGQVTAKDTNDYITCYTNYQSTMTEIKEDLVDDIGGYLRTRHVNGTRYLDYLAESPRTSNQVIRLGENLLDLVQSIDTEDLATVIIPLGATLDTQTIEGLDERLTIKTAPTDSMHPSGKDYVYSSDAVNSFGWIEKVVTWDDVTTVSALVEKGKKYLQETQWENLVITASAIDLGLTSDEFNKFRLLDMIRVVSAPHGLDRYFMLSKITINLNNPENDSITLGIEQTNKTLSAKTKNANDKILRDIEQLPTSNMVKSAIDNATALITGAEGGYVVTVTNSEGKPVELKIQDALNNPTKIWRWNQNGFGYSNDGGQTYGLAMTMDGSIVASYITSGTMTADRVRGGTFEVGGTSLGANGKILVKNSSGTTLITIDKNGITFSGGETIPYSAISDAPSIPSKTSELTNDSDWVTSTQATTITRDTVTTAFVNALNVTAKYISTKDLIATGISRIGGFVINDHYIQGFNNTNYNDSTIYCELGAWNPQWEQSGYAFAIWKRNNTSEQYKLKIGIRYDGSMVSESSLEIYPTDSTYGMWVHGKEYVEGDINLTGGLFTNYNVYAERNVSGATVDGRTGLNCTGGGLYVYGNIYADGGIGCGGTKSRIVETDNYGYRTMNAYETPSPYFGDIGEGILNEDGECIVYLDDVYLECVDLENKYQVFLQKYGQGDIWVEQREYNYFVVKGTANLRFGWEIKAIQKNYDSVRLDIPNEKMLATIIEQQAQEG